MFERSYPGIAVRAISLTFAVLFVLLLAYKTGLVRATRGFKLGVIAATGGIALVYLANMVMSIFFHTQTSFLYSSSPLGIGISLFVVVIAALNLVLDFDMIENAARLGAPRYMEWYGAFGMMVTLIWLYLEISALAQQIEPPVAFVRLNRSLTNLMPVHNRSSKIVKIRHLFQTLYRGAELCGAPARQTNSQANGTTVHWPFAGSGVDRD